MVTDAVIITVRNSSTRLPNKPLMLIKNKLCSIDIVIERAKKINLPIILATSTNSKDDVFVDTAHQHNIQIFRGALSNKIKRWYNCFNEFQLTNVLLIDGDDLSYDYNIGIRALNQLKSEQVDIIIHTPKIVCGFFTYAISYSGILKLYELATEDCIDTDVITRFIEMAKLNCSFIHLKNHECDKNVRLTLDYEEDLIFFRTLYDKLDITSSGKEIINYLEDNPDIVKINIHRQKDFILNQMKFNESI